ncbi:DUF2061 domain-containing protein [Thalassobellus suaedae]|uniref:DUF2061 domain-containing protein n=1 Tax=Thalassobellus suaedae TaxID=3074124 RepID=A0ABY9Y5R6_9FLAO|nr:DUF2061 domain-containing protein [Flavobacteriaceae bacterium HL-DH14]WNH13592.1 DUF2061 domain-containing protein [Flavobacteriaceae bacterium HL-DH10]
MIAQMLLKNKEKSTYKEDSVGEKPIRSVAKALSWRVVGTLDTLAVSFVLAQDITLAASIASVDFITKLILYFFHERAWNVVKWGK